MAARQKKLPKKVYTYSQLETILHAHAVGYRSNVLYGSVVARTTYPHRHSVEIAYVTDNLVVPLARVYRASNGDTAYAVLGPDSQYRARSPQKHKAIRDVWKRYVRAFTPYDERRVFADNRTYHYRVTKGVATYCWKLPGVWRHHPRGTLPAPKNWATQFDRKAPNFARRCRLFATRLSKAVSDGPLCVVQLCDHLHGDRAHIPFVGARLHVCTAPTAKMDGRRLLVMVARHDDESRKHHHVDGDYAIEHSQFLAVEEGKSWREGGMRWKCSADAIAGISEWVLGGIYIPGPEF